MKIDILNRWSGKVQFSCELSAELENASAGIKLGAAIKMAYSSGAVLRGADLSGAVLSGAVLRGAVLSDAVLSDADLSGADLSGAVLTPIRDDLWAVLSSAPAEVPALRTALADGKVDGSTYVGACACLVGTLAKARGCSENGIEGLEPNSSRPIERFFMGIKPGDTPDKNPVVKLALGWVDEWLANMRAAFSNSPASP